MRTQFSAYLGAVWRRIDKKTASLVAATFALILFGDTLLPLLGHGLHILYEMIESMAGHFLEGIFHLSKRQAEIIFFWSSLAIAIGLSWTLTRKAHRAARRAVTTVQERRRALAESATIMTWIRIALVISSLSATLFLFT